MINQKLYKSKIQIFLEYIFSFITILQCNSMYAFEGHDKIIINLLWQVILLVLLFISFSYSHFRFNNISKLVSFIFCFALVITSFFIVEVVYYPKFSKNDILIFLIDPILLVMYFFSYENTKYFNSLLYCFENLMYIIAGISLIFWILSNISIMPHSSVIISDFYGKPTAIPTYFNIGFVGLNKYSFLGFNTFRNTGIFTEPSMFAYSLNIAIFVNLFIKKDKIINKQLILLLIAMASSFSTTGIIFAILAIIYRFVISNNIKNVYKFLSLSFVPFLFIILRLIVNNKINSTSSSNMTSSYSVRLDDMEAGIKAWKNHIILGNGLDNLKSIKFYIAPWRFLMNRTGISAGFTTILAFGGIIFALFYVLPVIMSLMLSSYLRGFAIFSFLLIIFVFIQNRYECIVIISYLWASYISINKRNIILSNKSVKE